METGRGAGAKAVALRTRGKAGLRRFETVGRRAVKDPAGRAVHRLHWNGVEWKRLELAESGPKTSRYVVAEFVGPGSQEREPQPENSTASHRRL